MIRAPGIVLVGSLCAVVYGIALMVLSGREPVLFWYGLPVALLGLLLAGLWVRDRRRPLPPDTPESVAASVPGKWFPVTLLGIVVAQVVWLMIWSKL